MIVQVITVRLVKMQNHGNLRPADGAPARLLFQLGDARRTESLMPLGTNASRASRCSMRHTSHISCVHKNTVGGEIWCSFLSTHAFLLGNGQTYYRVSRIFTSRIFHPCNVVPHFHVPQFHVSHFQRPLSKKMALLVFTAKSGLPYET